MIRRLPCACIITAANDDCSHVRGVAEVLKGQRLAELNRKAYLAREARERAKKK